MALKRSRAPDKLACQGRRERLQQMPGALAPPGFGGGIITRPPKVGDGTHACRSGGHLASVIYTIAKARDITPPLVKNSNARKGAASCFLLLVPSPSGNKKAVSHRFSIYYIGNKGILWGDIFFYEICTFAQKICM